jgi:hypothetical protein
VELTLLVEIHAGHATVTVWVDGVRRTQFRAPVASHGAHAVQVGDTRSGSRYRMMVDDVRWDPRVIPA